ncbi:hypothetical protein KC887_01410 [Candidatus Kaiserbacteria bacterium]|nr:hypothetical protein [Candidatus Kaiserbacteria bacterium]
MTEQTLTIEQIIEKETKQSDAIVVLAKKQHGDSQGWEVAMGVWYTPDFTLDRCYVEVKHFNYDDNDVTEKMGLLVAGIRVPGVIIYGDPYEHIAVLYEPSYMLECGYVRRVASFLNLYGAVGAAIAARQAKFQREPAQ